MSAIVTLTTDFGLKDPYVGAMKGAMLGVAPALAIVDITHLVAPGAVLEGAFILGEACGYFPRGTVHVGVVDPGVGGKRKAILVEAGEYVFVGPDNGLVSLAVRRLGMKRAFEVTDERSFLPEVSSTFHGRDIFGPVAARVAAGASPGSFGPELGSIESLQVPVPALEGGGLSGEVIYVDSFGNLVTNIRKEELARFGAPVDVLIGDKSIHGVKKTYAMAEKGAPLALIGSSGLLEVAVSSGSAAGVLNCGVGEKVRVLPA